MVVYRFSKYSLFWLYLICSLPKQWLLCFLGKLSDYRAYLVLFFQIVMLSSWVFFDKSFVVLVVPIFLWSLFTIPSSMVKSWWLIGALEIIWIVLRAHEKPKSWCKYFAWAEYSINTGYHSSSNLTPLQVIMGGSHHHYILFVLGETKLVDLEVQLLTCDQMLKIPQPNILKAQSCIKSQVDSKQRELSFNVGDVVLLRL